MSISFPEIMATFTFLPMGLIMGYILYFFIISPTTLSFIRHTGCWPFIASAGTALFVLLIMEINKRRYRKFIFENFSLMHLGMLLQLIGGVLLYRTGQTYNTSAIYLCLIGHGFCYVPVLSYINIRASVTSSRKLRLALPHLIYIFGLAIGATVTVNNIHNNGGFIQLSLINRPIGSGIIIITIFILIGYIANDVMQYYKFGYNYKSSRDPNVQREIENEEIFKEKIFSINGREHLYSNLSLSQVEIDQITLKKDITTITFSIITRCLSILCLYYPLIYLTFHVSITVTGQRSFYTIHWITLFGNILGSLLLMSYMTKKLIIGTCISISISLVISTILTGFTFPSPALMGLLWIGYFVFGLGYAYPDVVTYELVSIQNSDIAATIGYITHTIVIGTLHYSVITNFSSWFCFNCETNVQIILGHSLTFILFAIVIIVFASSIIPNIESESLLEVKNIVLISMIKLFRRNQVLNQNYPPPTGVTTTQHIETLTVGTENNQNYYNTSNTPVYDLNDLPPPYQPPLNLGLQNEKEKI